MAVELQGNVMCFVCVLLEIVLICYNFVIMSDLDKTINTWYRTSQATKFNFALDPKMTLTVNVKLLNLSKIAHSFFNNGHIWMILGQNNILISSGVTLTVNVKLLNLTKVAGMTFCNI